jgi:RHS repeat-associated protein
MKSILRQFLLLFVGATTICATSGQMTTTAVSFGNVFSLALRSDGTVWSFGTNQFGEMGFSSATFGDSPFPVQIPGVSNIINISAGYVDSLVVSNNGWVFAWGANESGELGNGTTNDSFTAVRVNSITNAIAVASGNYHSLALLSNGQVMAWGWNGEGELGIGTTNESTVPVLVSNLSNIIKISTCGSDHSVALSSNGQVWCWGYGGDGEIGNGHTTNALVPVLVSGLSNITDVAAGQGHVIVLRSDGTVWTWGENDAGELGLNNTNAVSVPTVVASISQVQIIGAGYFSSAVTLGNGQTFGWGDWLPDAPTYVTDTPIFTNLTAGGYHFCGLTTNGTAWSWGYDVFGEFGNGNNEGWYGNNDDPDDPVGLGEYQDTPTLSFPPTPVGRWGQFNRGNIQNFAYCSIVAPLDLEQGVILNRAGTNQYCYTNEVPWFFCVQKQALYLPDSITTGTNLLRYPIDNPVVAFGSQGNGSPLYLNQPYRFGVYGGGLDESTSAATNVIRISVYSATNFMPGVTNVAPVNVFNIPLPRRTIPADSNAWYSFMTNGATTTFTTNGLTTTVEFLDDSDPTDMPFGVQWMTNKFGNPAIMTNFILSGYKLTHLASTTNYYYRVEVLGKVQVATNVLAPMATNSSGTWTSTPLYTLDFQQQPPLQSIYVDRLFFQGTPMPPTYENATFTAPNGQRLAVTNAVTLTGSAYTNVDASPELRRNPLLDQFVLDMNNDPLALASYVINQIDLTDPFALANSNQLIHTEIDCGGVDRSALGVFLEGQGSPIEQCSLLIYLLRQAGYAAAYVFPTNGNLSMLDTHISQLWRMRVNGVVDFYGVPYLTNSLITMNYPWVVANIGTNTVHIFPWLKDYQIEQGVNLYDYMPTNYNTGLQWVEQYVRANPYILGFSSENAPSRLFPAFVRQTLLTNGLGQNISLDDLGVNAVNRHHQFPTWSYLPQPDLVTNFNTAAIVGSLTDNTNTFPFLSHIFNTAEVQVYKNNTNSANLLLDTGVWDACDFNARKLLVFTNNSRLSLWLAPYRTNITTVQAFSAGLPSSTALLSNSVAIPSASLLAIATIHHRNVATLTNASAVLPVIEALGSTNVSHCLPGDVAGIAMDFGRISLPMLQPIEDQYWTLQRERATNTTFIPHIWDLQGTVAYLLAMSYWQKFDAFNQTLLQWHSLQGLVNFSSGLGIIGITPASTNMQVKVDMFTAPEAQIANGEVRSDSDTPDFSAMENYFPLLTAHASASEHDVIGTMFSDPYAVSTVRLLQLAQQRATNGNSPILEIFNTDYAAQGNLSDTGYGSTLLKNQDTNIWNEVTNILLQQGQYYARTLITPGRITNESKSYIGMGAMVLSYGQLAALISVNSATLNGGWGSEDPGVGSLPSSSVTLSWDMSVNPDGTPVFSYNDTSATSFDPTLAPQDSANLTSVNTPTWSPEQVTQASETLALFNQIGGSTTQGFEQAANNGDIGQSISWMDTVGQTANDPVDVVSGGFYVDAIDLTLPGPFPLQLRRSYLSQDLSDNPFGYGWKINFMPYLVLTTNIASQSVIYAAELNGAIIAYHQTNTTTPWVVLPQDNPSLNNNSVYGIGSAANLFNSHLTTNAAGYVISAPDGSTRVYQIMSFPIYSGTNQMTRTRPYLTEWQDHSGNYALFYYGTNTASDDYGQLNRINMANGNTLVFKYDFYGRITQAITGDGRFVQYEYDNYGDLVTVTLPDASQCQYQYEHYTFTSTNGATIVTNTDSYHLMTQEIKPDGRTIANNYDSLRRVTNQACTCGTNLALVTNAWFYYTNNVTSVTNQFDTGYTRVEDVFHNPTVYYYTNNAITNIIDPFGQSTVQTWFPDTPSGASGYYPRSLQYTIDKRGLTNQYYYDASGNVTQKVVLGNITGEGVPNQSATSVATYTTNDLPLTLINPVGNGAQYIYDSSDPYQLDQEIHTSSGASVFTNLYFYTNVSQISTTGTTNFAFGLLWRQVKGGSTNDFFYNGQGFKTEQIQCPATAQNPWDTDPEVVTLLSYNERGQCYQQQIVGGALIQMDFDPMGRMTSRQIFDQNNNNVSSESFYYNQNGELEWYQGPRSNPSQYVYYIYDGAGREIQQIQWRSQGKINGSGVEAPSANAAYATTFRTFDGFGNLTSVTDARGVLTTNTWDALGRKIQQKVIDTNGALLTTQGFAYESGNQVAYVTNSLHGVAHTLYTQTGQPYFQQNLDGSTNGWTYYLDGRIKQRLLANGSYWLYAYDDVNLLTTRTFYSGGATLSTSVAGFDARGNQILSIDGKGYPFTNGVDGLNRVKFKAGPLMVNILTNVPLPTGGNSQTNSFQAASTNFYDAAGLAITNLNILGETAIIHFDVLGRQIDQEFYSPTATLARITTTSYSADHQSETITQGSGSTAIVNTIYTDNANKPVLTISYPSFGVEEFILDRYDAVENLISETHNTISSGAITTWTTTSLAVDGLNRLISKTDRDGAVTSYGYDTASDPTNQTVPGGVTWAAAYNSAQQKLYDFDSTSGGSVTRSNSYTYYSGLGLEQTKTDGRGVTCTHYYDAFLRPASNVYSGPLPEHNMTISWAYDPRSLVTNIAETFTSTNTGPGLTVSRSYGSYSEITQDIISGAVSYSATESYDADIRRTGLGINNFGWGFSYQADGLLTSVGGGTQYGGATFTYSTSGLLLTRAFSPRTTSITQFDGDGRPLAATTTANGSTVLTETTTYTPDGLLATHTIMRPDFTDNRTYTYANLSRRLTQETTGVSASNNWTSAFIYDKGVPGGPGVLTRMGQAAETNVSWNGGTDAFSRINMATNTVAQREAYGVLNGTATMTALLDGNPMPVTLFGTNDNYRWQAQLSLLPGPHKLVVNALNWSGYYTASATNTFTNSAVDHVQETYAGNGEVTNRVWITAGGKTNATQSLSFDAMDRLHSVTYLDTNNNGYTWSAVYDGFGRRMSTTTSFVTNGIVLSNLSKTIDQLYDPNVEFLELAESDSGNTVWKFYGPDINGTYGGMQGVGGLEAVVNGPRESSPMISDLRGNILGLYNLSQASTVLFPSRVTAYGSVPGYAPLPVADGALVGQSSAWRGKWPDITGLYYLGSRYYDPTAGNFLSFDPSWNTVDPNGFTFCGGDPINGFDPTGRGKNPFLPQNLTFDNILSLGTVNLGSTTSEQNTITLTLSPFSSATGTDNTPPDLSMNSNPNVYPPSVMQQEGAPAVISPSPFTDLNSPTSYGVQNLDNSSAAQAVFQLGVQAAIVGGQIAISEVAPELLLSDATTLTAESTVAAGGDHIVLGMQEFGLEQTASQVGGRTLMGDANWQTTLQTALGDSSSRITVSLDGASGPTPYSQFMSAAQQGLTPGATPFNWEMGQIYQAGRQGTVTFMQGGQIVPNPFQ